MDHVRSAHHCRGPWPPAGRAESEWVIAWRTRAPPRTVHAVAKQPTRGFIRGGYEASDLDVLFGGGAT
ncbi:hypothetical protein GCM10017744_089890 [Streptomyces antimycoticus]